MTIKIGSTAKAVGNIALSMLIAAAAQAAAEALADLAAGITAAHMLAIL
jgi:hypothetical protein